MQWTHAKAGQRQYGMKILGGGGGVDIAEK